MRLGFASTFIGAGIAIIAMVLPMIWEDPPEWVLLVLLSLGGLLFLVGVLTLAWALTEYERNVPKLARRGNGISGEYRQREG